MGVTLGGFLHLSCRAHLMNGLDDWIWLMVVRLAYITSIDFVLFHVVLIDLRRYSVRES